MPSKLFHRSPKPIAQPPLPCTSPPQTPPLPPSPSVPIHVPSIAIPGLHDAIYGGETSFSMEDPNAELGDSKVQDVQPVRVEAPSAEASKLPRHEVGLVTYTFYY
jgi:hypothetical protein